MAKKQKISCETCAHYFCMSSTGATLDIEKCLVSGEDLRFQSSAIKCTHYKSNIELTIEQIVQRSKP